MRGSIIKRGKTFTIYYYIGKDENGKWRQKSEGGFPTKREAERTLRQRIDAIEETYNGNLSCRTVTGFLNYWLENYCERNLAENTVRGYRTNVEKHIIPHIGKIMLLKLAPKDIQDLYSDLLDDGLSPTTVRYVHNNLHKAFAYGVKMQFLPKNPADMLEPPKPKHYDAAVLSPDEILRLLQVCSGKDLYWPVLLAVTLGLRRGEALGLRWEDVDFENKMIYIRHSASSASVSEFKLSDPKSKSSIRALLLPEYILQGLNLRYQSLESKRKALGLNYNAFDVVCYRDEGTPFSNSALQHQFKHALDVAKLPAIRFHDLRHTNATLLLRNGIPAKIVSTMSGHSTIQLTMDTYSHVVPEMQEGAINAVDSLLQSL